MFVIPQRDFKLSDGNVYGLDGFGAMPAEVVCSGHQLATSFAQLMESPVDMWMAFFWLPGNG
jgi:hypothetical protein